jgi:hypothetical protein
MNCGNCNRIIPESEIRDMGGNSNTKKGYCLNCGCTTYEGELAGYIGDEY